MNEICQEYQWILAYIAHTSHPVKGRIISVFPSDLTVELSDDLQKSYGG
jgi:hypothetical protein